MVLFALYNGSLAETLIKGGAKPVRPDPTPELSAATVSRQDDRARREAEALRENLLRRKQQARARKALDQGPVKPT